MRPTTTRRSAQREGVDPARRATETAPGRKRSPRTRRARILTGIAGLAAAALVLTGCAVQVRSQPDSTIGPDTMLINADHGNPQFDRNFNPYLANARTASKWMYEPLILTNPLDGEQTPWLASAVDQPDPKTIDFTIRKDVTWSDGEPFTAADVKFTFDLAKKFEPLDIKGIWQHISSLETTKDADGEHVIVHLKTADVPAVGILGGVYIVSEHQWSKVKDPTTWRNPNPIGTGPFTLGNYSPLQYSMDKNKSYWQADKIQIEHLILPATNSQLDTVARGYDWAYSYISDVSGTWGAASKSNQWWFPAAGVIGLTPNLTKAPFDNVDVRRGISLALDRDKIADSATEGNLTAAGQTGLILPNQEKWLNPDIPDGGLIKQDVDAALASFAKAGYTQKDGKLVDQSGKQLSFSILTANGYSDWLRAVQEAQRNLTAIGIDVKITAPQPAGYQQAIDNGKFDMAMGGMGNGDVYQSYNSLLSSEFYQPVGKSAQNNRERFKDPAVDKLLVQLKSTIDEEDQKPIVDELQQVVYDQLPVIGMYYGGSWGLFSDAKFTGWPTAKDPYMIPQNYDSAPLGIFVRLKRVDK
ncbi:ABC transporter substrate-binding protein [Schumannella luteola]|uniref:Peptide/nickel transport system substrate-binding protein n=1 Tax=Schumannella luteola TaxID=472059 RepID=A0A852YKC3_9MICO|nr:ABC transporter substrate-binding protein [Schumannella luteola]NYG98179.1 peptide/nickel transport system substrate-binding protein [Schumannella luteola]TPW90471.1 ABC transporter substrate-binding protein [Schumannella luteola]